MDKPEGLCRMEVKVWLSGTDPDMESMFLEHCLSHLISGAMTESPKMFYRLNEDGTADSEVLD